MATGKPEKQAAEYLPHHVSNMGYYRDYKLFCADYYKVLYGISVLKQDGQGSWWTLALLKSEFNFIGWQGCAYDPASWAAVVEVYGFFPPPWAGGLRLHLLARFLKMSLQRRRRSSSSLSEPGRRSSSRRAKLAPSRRRCSRAGFNAGHSRCGFSRRPPPASPPKTAPWPPTRPRPAASSRPPARRAAPE